jgi:hypothetical protein
MNSNKLAFKFLAKIGLIIVIYNIVVFALFTATAYYLSSDKVNATVKNVNTNNLLTKVTVELEDNSKATFETVNKYEVGKVYSVYQNIDKVFDKTIADSTLFGALVVNILVMIYVMIELHSAVKLKEEKEEK